MFNLLLIKDVDFFNLDKIMYIFYYVVIDYIYNVN